METLNDGADALSGLYADGWVRVIGVEYADCRLFGRRKDDSS